MDNMMMQAVRTFGNTAQAFPTSETADPRLVPFNGRVAASYLQGQVPAQTFYEGRPMMCTGSRDFLLDAPGGKRISQLLYGDLFTVYERGTTHAFVQMDRDGHCGYVSEDYLSVQLDATHWVVAPTTHLFPAPDASETVQDELFFGADVTVIETIGNWALLASGQYVPTAHLLPLNHRLDDVVGVADLFLGVPYLSGGLTRYGMDGAGLVNIAWRACGRDCPRALDMQEAELGQPLYGSVVLQRGDLIFWGSHVGIMSDHQTLLHANPHHMSVAYEPLADAVARMEATGGGQITSIKRA